MGRDLSASEAGTGLGSAPSNTPTSVCARSTEPAERFLPPRVKSFHVQESKRASQTRGQHPLASDTLGLNRKTRPTRRGAVT